MQTTSLTYAGQTVALADLPEYAKFYRKLTAGTWEPRTFAVLARNLDAQTAYLDIGAWIGVTPLWAAGRAAKVVAVEPDPKCRAILRALTPAYPNVTLYEGALSPEPSVTLNAVGGFGSSETSILSVGDGGQDTAQGWPMQTLLAATGDGPVFVKIDIEGYEYLVQFELAHLRAARVTGIQIALHPALYARSLKGPFRRLRAALATWRLNAMFRPVFGTPAIHKRGSVLSYLLFDILLKANPRGTDFVYERS